MKQPTFEDYLKDWHLTEAEPMTLDDDLPDAYEHWITTLDVEELIKYADRAMKLSYDLGCLHGHKDGLEENNQ